MPKVGDMRMIDGLIHEVAWVARTSNGVEYWQTLCPLPKIYNSSKGVRVGPWTYPTCLACAGNKKPRP